MVIIAMCTTAQHRMIPLSLPRVLSRDSPRFFIHLSVYSLEYMDSTLQIYFRLVMCPWPNFEAQVTLSRVLILLIRMLLRIAIVECFLSSSGFMRITGRIKELIITAGGENVPPVLIEVQFCLGTCVVGVYLDVLRKTQSIY